MTYTSKIALLIIDLQNAYFNNDALRDQQTELVAKANELIATARKWHMPIFNVLTQHQKDIATWTLNMIDDGSGYLFAGDDDAKNIDGLQIHDCIKVIKTRDSAFYGTSLATMLCNYHTDTLIICGVSTHTCVCQTATDAYAANYRIILATDAIATHDPKHHKNALAILETEYRQRCMTMAQLQNYIQNQRQ